MLPTLLTPGSIEGIDEVPIKYIVSWIKNHMFEYGYISAMFNDRILIIKAKTGSGKSTVMPVELFRILRNKDTSNSIPYNGLKVLCTQPRVLTAIELARGVSSINSSWNPDMILGKIVGYSTGPKKERANGLIYATAGVLRAKLNNNTDDEIMNEYKFIIIDEAHERSVDSDVLLFMLYKFYKRNEGNKNLPFLILTSATFDTLKYANYFNISNNNIINISGIQYNIKPHYLSDDTNNIYESIINIISKINKNKDDPEKADVLIFAPGMKEMNEIELQIKKYIKEYVLVLKLDGEAVRKETQDYLLVFENYKKLPKLNNKLPLRRIIISTSVAETGLTINTLKYVIDMGFHRGIESYPIYNIRGLITRPATQSRIIQRKGRCGRLFDGEFYALYTKLTYDTLDEQQLPDIITSSEEYNMVHLLFYRLSDEKFNIKQLKLLDKPSLETFIGANIIATLLGFINHESKLTKLGLIASKFNSISMEGAKIILSGFAFNVSITDLITIVSFMYINNGMLFLKDHMYKKIMKDESYNINIPCNAHIMKSILPSYISDIVEDNKNKDSDNYYYRYKTILCDDFIESLLAFESFNKQIIKLKNNKNIIEWCQKKCLNYSTLNKVYEIRERIIDDLLSVGIDILYNNEYQLINQPIDNFMNTVINIKRCLYEGLKHNLLEYDKEYNTYKSLHGLSINIDNSILSYKLQNKLKSLNLISDNIYPKYIITDKFILSLKNSDTIMYDITTNYISILDGYIYPDTTIGQPTYKKNMLNNVKKYNNIDNISLLNLYDKLNKYINIDIKMPLCYLTNTIKLFGSNINNSIINQVCK
jgi:HrpA-like RNA helicase